APTLHRLGIQAFQPVLIEGSAIQIHPLVCAAFNADFDGDQMAVHVPLSRMAVLEARKAMLSVYNMLSPASGEPLVSPTLDMVLGCYYLTELQPGARGEGSRFVNVAEARLVYELGRVSLHAEIWVQDRTQPDGWLRTSVGRLIFNEVLPEEVGFKNEIMDKKALKDLTTECYHTLGNERTAEVLDKIKHLGFHYATQSGITIGINDIQVSPRKEEIIREATSQVDTLEEQYLQGLISEEERYNRAVAIWTEASDRMTQIVEEEMADYGGIAMMAISGAKGNIAQIKQMTGMRGLMSNPKGRIIDLPIKSSFREGLSVLEYFISTHGARKGLADTALRTADSGYLTRRLIDIAQEVIILEQDCGTTTGIWAHRRLNDPLVSSLKERILGRLAAAPVTHPDTGEVLVDRNEIMDEEKARLIEELGIPEVYMRSPLSCEARRGVCQACYGWQMARGTLVQVGEAVGIIAAQSIGEPGTQLTMRTFHTGGVAGIDIVSATGGLPRVEELLEARVPRQAAIMSDIDGVVELLEEGEERKIRVVSREEYREQYKVPKGYGLLVAAGEQVESGAVLAQSAPPAAKGKSSTTKKEPRKIVAQISGRVELQDGRVAVVYEDVYEREYPLPLSAHVLVENGARVKAGDPLTSGQWNPHDILRINGREATQEYIVDEAQRVYRNQGVTIHDKHIEVIVRQMLRRVNVDSAGDTDFLPGEYVDRFLFQETNAKVLAEGGEPATARPALLGVTRAALLTDSFLAAASFQETTRVLTESAVRGAEDRLLGLKENVIIGRLIPARLDVSEEGRKLLGLPAPQEVTLPESAWLGLEELAPKAGDVVAVGELPHNGGGMEGSEEDEEAPKRASDDDESFLED
ncbi:MAG: DNA-directed RNA polymerase subunit beta', partial [Dehalococcoidia bacterium]